MDFSFEFPTQLRYSTVFLLFILTIFMIWFLGFLFVWPRKLVKKTLRDIGVAMRRIGRTMREMERKTCYVKQKIKYPLSHPCTHSVTQNICIDAVHQNVTFLSSL